MEGQMKVAGVMLKFKKKRELEKIKRIRNRRNFVNRTLKAAFVCALAALCLCGCYGSKPGKVDLAGVKEGQSAIYSAQDLEEAQVLIMDQFASDFRDCTMTSLEYAGDEASSIYAGWGERNFCDQVAVFVMDFETGDLNPDNPLNPNSDYDSFLCILARNNDEPWQWVDGGY